MNSRRGFTLVELLVVIAIIAILVALLLPAVQSSREAGRRASCSNKLRQLALGVLNFESAQQRYPSGGETKATDCPLSGSSAVDGGPSWSVLILPYCEGQAIYDSLNMAAPFSAMSWDDGLANFPRQFRPNSAFQCPGGAMFARADGAVTFVFQDIDLDLYRSFGQRNSGQTKGGF